MFYFCILLLQLILFTSCQTSNQNLSAFGKVNDNELSFSDLTPSEKLMINEAQKKVYETAQDILDKRYLTQWFTQYQLENKFANLEEARKNYFSKTIVISQKDINDFIEKYKSYKEFLNIPENERLNVVTTYLTKVAIAQEEQKILNKATKENKIQILAFQLPQTEKISFHEGGHVWQPNLKNAKVTIVELADYECPYCVQSYKPLHSFLEQYKDKVQFIFRDFPLTDKHPQALPAAIAALCAEKQGKYWEMQNLIFTRSANEKLSDDLYSQFAEKLNLNLIDFKSCENNPESISTIQADIHEGIRIGITGTPSIYINGEKFENAISFDNLKQKIDQILQ